jgi:hypothetical protein
MLTNNVTKIFVYASSSIYGDNSILKKGLTSNVVSLMLPIGIVIGVIYWLISFMDKVDSEKITTELLVKHLFKLIIGILIISNSFSLAYAFDEFTTDMIADIEGITKDADDLGKDTIVDAEDKMAASAQRKYQRITNHDDEWADEENEDEDKEGEDSKDKKEKTTEEKKENTSGGTKANYSDALDVSGYPQDVALQIASTYKSNGYSDAAICGILGNLCQESGLNPEAYVYADGDCSYGLYQVNGGKNIPAYGSTADTQTQYAIDIRIPEEYSGHSDELDKLKNATDPVVAAELFCVWFEKCTLKDGSRESLTTQEGKDAAATKYNSSSASSWTYSNISNRIGYAKGWANTLDISIIEGSSNTHYLTDKFTNSLSVKETVESSIEILIIGIISLAIKFSLYGVAYARAIKIFYMLIFAPIALGKLFVASRGLTGGVTDYFKQLLATFMIYPATYLLCKFYLLVISTIFDADSAVPAMIGILLVSVIAMIISMRKLGSAIEGFFSR